MNYIKSRIKNECEERITHLKNQRIKVPKNIKKQIYKVVNETKNESKLYSIRDLLYFIFESRNFTNGKIDQEYNILLSTINEFDENNMYTLQSMFDKLYINVEKYQKSTLLKLLEIFKNEPNLREFIRNIFVSKDITEINVLKILLIIDNIKDNDYKIDIINNLLDMNSCMLNVKDNKRYIRDRKMINKELFMNNLLDIVNSLVEPNDGYLCAFIKRLNRFNLDDTTMNIINFLATTKDDNKAQYVLGLTAYCGFSKLENEELKNKLLDLGINCDSEDRFRYGYIEEIVEKIIIDSNPNEEIINYLLDRIPSIKNNESLELLLQSFTFLNYYLNDNEFKDIIKNIEDKDGNLIKKLVIPINE